MSTSQRSPFTPPGLRLHLNENSAGCSPAVLQALASLTADDVAQYPDYASTIRATSEWLGVREDWLLLVNGLDEGLHLASAAATAQSAEASGFSGVVLEPAFEMYAACIEESRGVVTRVLPRPNFEFSFEDVLAASTGARVIYLTDPNNPTGLGLPEGTIERLAASRPDALIFVDEAYADFSGRTFVTKMRAPDYALTNVIVGRTFAKGHGLAALRIGALVAPPSTLAPLAHLQAPYSLNVAATTALRAALSDERWLNACVREAHESKTAIYEWCERIGISYWKSDANFVLIRVGPTASALVAALAEQQIYIRDRSHAPGCAGCVRITAGVLAYTAKCLRAMETFLTS